MISSFLPSNLDFPNTPFGLPIFFPAALAVARASFVRIEIKSLTVCQQVKKDIEKSSSFKKQAAIAIGFGVAANLLTELIKGLADMEHIQNIIVLFDEYGTPNFRSPDVSDTSTFLGVTLIYPEFMESDILAICDVDFGLSNSKPKKNRDIDTARAVRMCKCIGSQSVHLTVGKVDLTNPKLQIELEAYLKQGVEVLSKDRALSQVIHGQVMEMCLCNAILAYDYRSVGGTDLRYVVLCDNWSFPAGVQAALDDQRSPSIEQHIMNQRTQLGRQGRAVVAPTQFLDSDSKRKRLIDGCATICSRAYLSHSHRNYSEIPLEALEERLGDRISQIDMSSGMLEVIKGVGKLMDARKTALEK